MINEDDLRVQRTRRLLKEAFVKLVMQQGYEAVTIRDITGEAQVGYKTFFRHYDSKEMLLYTILEEILEKAQPLLLTPETPFASEQNTINAVRFAQQHGALFRVLLSSPAAEKLIQPLVLFGLSEGSRFFGGGSTPDEVVAYHFVAGMMHMIRWWLENDQPYPPEEMAEYINRVLIRPLEKLAVVYPALEVV